MSRTVRWCVGRPVGLSVTFFSRFQTIAIYFVKYQYECGVISFFQIMILKLKTPFISTTIDIHRQGYTPITGYLQTVK